MKSSMFGDLVHLPSNITVVTAFSFSAIKCDSNFVLFRLLLCLSIITSYEIVHFYFHCNAEIDTDA